MFVIVVSSIFSLSNGSNRLPNILVYLYIVLPVLVIYFSNSNTFQNKNNLAKIKRIFIKASTYILVATDIAGFFTFFFMKRRVPDDSFIGLYGTHFNSVHGLSVVNSILFIYYFSILDLNSLFNRKSFFAFFFFVSTMFCFYGLGTVCLAGAFMLYIVFHTKLLKKLKILLFISFGIIVLIPVYKENMGYIVNNILKFSAVKSSPPRKILVFLDYYQRLGQEPYLLFSGMGPGAYNSRIAFLLNNDSSNPFTSVLGKQMPYYHEKGPFELWNKKTTSFEKFQDGTRNKPFSSFLSILSENGILFFIFFVAYFKQRYMYSNNTKDRNNRTFLIISGYFMAFSLISEMWLETSEFLFYIVFLFFLKFPNVRTDTPKVQE